MRKIGIAVLLVLAVAGRAIAQASIDPGMSREQVIAKLGKPASEHSSGTTTYLYYSNGQERKFGMSDLVALDDGKVVDAVFRSSARRYSGKSSSPAPVSAEAAIAKGNGGKAPVPPTRRAPEPRKGVDTRKIQPPAKSADSARKPAPVPAKKP
jgi:outer membrane protein assembly factor BamE (lipoprotein component of BamABCDE complex)